MAFFRLLKNKCFCLEVTDLDGEDDKMLITLFLSQLKAMIIHVLKVLQKKVKNAWQNGDRIYRSLNSVYVAVMSMGKYQLLV